MLHGLHFYSAFPPTVLQSTLQCCAFTHAHKHRFIHRWRQRCRPPHQEQFGGFVFGSRTLQRAVNRSWESNQKHCSLCPSHEKPLSLSTFSMSSRSTDLREAWFLFLFFLSVGCLSNLIRLPSVVKCFVRDELRCHFQVTYVSFTNERILNPLIRFDAFHSCLIGNWVFVDQRNKRIRMRTAANRLWQWSYTKEEQAEWIFFKSREGRYVVRIMPVKLLLNWGGVMRERVMWSRGKSSEMSWKLLLFCHRTEPSLSVIITDSRHCPYCLDKKCSTTLGLSEIIENVSLNVTNEKAKIGQLTTSSTMFWRTAQISVAVEGFCRTLGLCDR